MLLIGLFLLLLIRAYLSYLAYGRGLHLVISHQPPGLQQPTGHTAVLAMSSPGCCTPHALLKDIVAL